MCAQQFPGVLQESQVWLVRSIMVAVLMLVYHVICFKFILYLKNSGPSQF